MWRRLIQPQDFDFLTPEPLRVDHASTYDGRGMEEVFKQIAGYIALGVEASAALIIAYGALQALYGSFRTVIEKRSQMGQRKDVLLNFGVWLLLGLEFELAADIVRTAISPTWSEIGQLAAIGLIRTFLNFFLEKDLEKYESQETEPQKGTASSLAA